MHCLISVQLRVLVCIDSADSKYDQHSAGVSNERPHPSGSNDSHEPQAISGGPAAAAVMVSSVSQYRQHKQMSMPPLLPQSAGEPIDTYSATL